MKKLFRAGPVLTGASLAAVLILSAGIAASDKDFDDAPEISVSPISGLVTTEDGGTATFTVVLNSDPTDEVTIDLVTSDASEGTVSPASLSFTPSDWDLPQTVTVTGVDDDANDGDVRYKVVTTPAASGDGDYSGVDAADISVLNTDNDGDSTDDKITPANADSSGGEADFRGTHPSISADGRFVAFCWPGSYRFPGDTNVQQGIFVHDCETGVAERVSVESSTREQLAGWCLRPSISADGRFVAFDLKVGDMSYVFVHDRETGLMEKASVDLRGGDANGRSYRPSLSRDGRFVTFEVSATNLVAGDTDRKADIFVHDRKTGRAEKVSVSSSGGVANGARCGSRAASISADGRFVAFMSDATNLVPGDTNHNDDIFVRDRENGVTEKVSVSSSGGEADNDSYLPSISADGRIVAFYSYATNLVPGDTNDNCDIFVRDRETSLTEKVSVSLSGSEANDFFDHTDWSPAICADGRFVAFISRPRHPAPGDTHGLANIFVHDRQTGKTERVGFASFSGKVEGDCSPSISADGRFVAFARYRKDTFTGFGLMSDVFVARNPLAP